MAHESQERYSKLVDTKLRFIMVKKDGVIFNNRYEGTPTAGSVKIPVRDTEVTTGDYDKQRGGDASHGGTSYITLVLDKDKYVNEIIDGFDAASVPDNLVADRLDSAGYSMALQLETDATACLESAATQFGSTTALTKTAIYETLVDIRAELSAKKVPNDGMRFALVSPAVYSLILKSPEFIAASDLGDRVKQTGAQGRIAGLNIYEDPTLSATTEIIAGHPNWCSRVHEWAVPVRVQNLNESGTYIGASAVQGRKIYGHKVTKPETLLIKKTGSGS